MQITLYPFPASCSRVTMVALEEIGIDYATHCVNIRKAEQTSPAYLAINPKGKVPAMAVDGILMTENVAMLWFLHQQFPQAALLPQTGDAVRDHRGLIDLVWVSSTLHPNVRQIRMPVKLTRGDPEAVRADGMAKFAVECDRMEARIGSGWWYGGSWSILDAISIGPTARRKRVVSIWRPGRCCRTMPARVRARPAFQRVLAKERAMVAAHDIEGVEL
jgi:glutathione S-transferase